MAFDWMWGTTGIKDAVLGKESTFDPLSAYTPEQLSSVKGLQSLASTGTGAGITLGEGFEGPLGNFDVSGQQQAQKSLSDLRTGSDLTTARNTFTDLANTEFDPSDPKSGYAAFSKALAREGQKSTDLVNREAARTGGVFGSGRGEELSQVAEGLSLQRGQFLSNLFQNGRAQQLAGAQGLFNIAGQDANVITEISRQAQLENAVKDAEARSALTEFKRVRAEELSRIGLMQDQFNNPLGPIEEKSTGYLGQLIGAFGGIAGSYISANRGNKTAGGSSGVNINSRNSELLAELQKSGRA